MRWLHAAVVLGYTTCFGLMNPILPYHTRAVIASDMATPSSLLATSGLSALLAYSCVLSAYSAIKLLSLPLVTAAADRHGRMHVLRITLTGLGLASALTAWAPGTGVALLLRAAMGVCGANSALLQAWASDLVNTHVLDHDQSRVRHQLNKDGFLLWHVGSVLGAVGVPYLPSHAACCILAAMAVFASTLLLSFATVPATTPSSATSSTSSTKYHKHASSSFGLWSLICHVAGDASSRQILAVDVLTMLTPRLDFVPILDQQHLGATALSHVLFGSSVASIVFAVVRPKALDRLDAALATALGYIGVALSVAILPFVPHSLLWVVLLLRAVMMGVAEPAEKTMWSRLAPPEHVALFLGLQHTVRGVQQTVGTFLTTYLAEVDLAWPYCVIAVCHVGVAVLFYIGASHKSKGKAE